MSAPKATVDLVRRLNPFTYQGAITRKELFFDRVIELEDATLVCEQIVRGGAGGVLVLGGRGTGKTSFLNALDRKLESLKIPRIKLSLDEEMVEKNNEPRLFKLIVNDLTLSAEAAGLIDRGIGAKIRQILQGVIKFDSVQFQALGFGVMAKAAENPQAAPFSYALLRDGLKDLLGVIKPREGERTPGAILMLDEGDVLTKNRTLLQVLRNVFQEAPGMGIVIAGTSKLLGEVSVVFSPIPRFFRKIELGPFPDDSDVDYAITKTVELAKSELLGKQIRVNVLMRHFIPDVAKLSGRAPLDFNLLSYFAYDIAASNIGTRDGMLTLFLRLDRDVMEQAIKQLRGTKEYAAFLDSLSNDDRIVLTLLSKCPHGASTDELTALLTLDGLGDSLRLTSVRQLAAKLDEIAARREPCEKSLEKMRGLGDKVSIRVLNADLEDRVIYRVEDQWVSAYFKYSGFQTFVNLEYGLIAGESGILIFGDPVSSILDNIFLHKIMRSFAQGDSFKVNYYPNDGSNLRSHKGKILNASFLRIADGKTWHLAFNLEAGTATDDIKSGMTEILRKLQDVGVIKTFQVKERVLNGPWV